MGDVVDFRKRADVTTDEVRARQAEKWLEADRAKSQRELARVKITVIVLIALLFLAAAVIAHAITVSRMP